MPHHRTEAEILEAIARLKSKFPESHFQYVTNVTSTLVNPSEYSFAFIGIRNDTVIMPAMRLSGKVWEDEMYQKIHHEYLTRSTNWNTIIDVGSNMGVNALMFALMFPSCHVFSFDFMPIYTEICKENAWINRLTNRVTFFNFAIHNKDDVQLALPSNHRALGTQSQNFGGIGAFSHEGTEFVTTRRIETLATKLGGFPNIGFIKVDTEGNELEVLEGSKELLTRDKPIVICEVWPDLEKKMFESDFWAWLENSWTGIRIDKYTHCDYFFSPL